MGGECGEVLFEIRVLFQIRVLRKNGGGSHRSSRIRNGVMSLGGSSVQPCCWGLQHVGAGEGAGRRVSRGSTWGVEFRHGVC